MGQPSQARFALAEVSLGFFLRSAEPNLSECVQMAVSFGCPSSMLATESASDSV
jgi:hypothetical protein